MASTEQVLEMLKDAKDYRFSPLDIDIAQRSKSGGAAARFSGKASMP